MRMRLIPLMILCAVMLIACGGAPSASNADPLPTRTSPPPPTDVPPTPTPFTTIEVTGAGGSLPLTLFTSWFELFTFVTPRPHFTYNTVGSARGIEMILNNEIDFAASEIPLTAEQKAQAPELMMFPTAAGAVVIAYNLSDPSGGLIRSGLHFDADVLAAIYMGRITRWNDPAITAINPEIAFPDQDIVVLQRTSGSGTTFLFTSYLNALSTEWRQAIGADHTIEWPIGTSVETNEAMANAIVETPFSIGYVDLGHARVNYLTYGLVKNREGRFVEANVESIQAAQSSTVLHMPDTMDQVLVNAPGVTSYPIAGYSYLMFYANMDDCDKAWSVISWYRWGVLLGDVSAAEAGFAPVIPEVETLAFTRFDQLFCNNHSPLPRLAVPMS